MIWYYLTIVPQAPQFLGSVNVLVQFPLQQVGDVALHWKRVSTRAQVESPRMVMTSRKKVQIYLPCYCRFRMSKDYCPGWSKPRNSNSVLRPGTNSRKLAHLLLSFKTHIRDSWCLTVRPQVPQFLGSVTKLVQFPEQHTGVEREHYQ